MADEVKALLDVAEVGLINGAVLLLVDETHCDRRGIKRGLFGVDWDVNVALICGKRVCPLVEAICSSKRASGMFPLNDVARLANRGDVLIDCELYRCDTCSWVWL